MKKVIDSSEETTNVTISYFASPFFNHFSFSLNRKKMRGNENHKSHIHASGYPAYPAFMGNCLTINHIC